MPERVLLDYLFTTTSGTFKNETFLISMLQLPEMEKAKNKTEVLVFILKYLNSNYASGVRLEELFGRDWSR